MFTLRSAPSTFKTQDCCSYCMSSLSAAAQAMIYILTRERNFLSEDPSSLKCCLRVESSLVLSSKIFFSYTHSSKDYLVILFSFFFSRCHFLTILKQQTNISAETDSKKLGGGEIHPSTPTLSSLRLTVRVVGLLPRWLKSWLSYCGIWGSTLHVLIVGI